MKVAATGVFEILHPGHIQYLEQAKSLGDTLCVIVARDSTAKKRKRRPVIGEKQRLHMVASLKPVDQAVLGDTEDFFETIKRIRPDILAIGPDQDHDIQQLQTKMMDYGLSTRIVRIKDYWESGLHSTTIIVDLIKNEPRKGTL